MEAALVDSIAVASVTPRSFLLFFRQLSELKALFVTPKTYFPLAAASPLPALPSDLSGVRECLASCRAHISVQARQFALSGSLVGGGQCCAKGSGLELEAKKSSKWGEIMRKISQATDKESVKAELGQLKAAVREPTLEEFREVIDDMTKLTWRNMEARNALIKYLLRGSESMFMLSETSGLASSPPLCERVQNGLTQVRHRLLTGTPDEIYQECCLDVIASALQEISEGGKSPAVGVIKAALQGQVGAELSVEDPVFKESLVAAFLPIRLAAQNIELRGLLEPLYQTLNECPWQVQALLVHRVMKMPVKDSTHEELTEYFAKYFEPLLGVNDGPNSWKVRAVAAQSLGKFLNGGAAETPKEAASGFILTALERESSDNVIQILQQLPRTYLNPSLICTSLAGAGSGGLFNFKTGELKGFDHPLLHGTGRAVASLKDTLILTGGLINPKKCFEIDPESMKVRELATMNVERFWHGACLVGLDVVVCGGRSIPDGEALNSAEKLVGDKWVVLPNMTCRRESHSCAGWGTLVYAVGGLGDEASPVSIEVLEHNAWRKLDIVLPFPLLVPGVYLKAEDQMVLGGGRAEETLAAVHILSLKTGELQKLPDLPHACAFSSDLVEMRENCLFFLSSETKELFKLDLGSQEWTVREY